MALKENLSWENHFSLDNETEGKHINIITSTSIESQLPLIRESTLHKKSSFLLKISSVNVTNSAGSCGFSHIY